MKDLDEKYREILENLTIMDDIFMRNVFKDAACTEYILKIILNRTDITVSEQILQKDYKNLRGRSAILDCVARDSSGKIYDIEIQQADEGASPKRARYYSSLMDLDALKPGQDFEELPESYVIFITERDVLGKGLAIYHADRKLRESGEDFEDHAHIIYVNASNREDNPLGRLMHDLNCSRADDIYSENLARRVRELKETQKEGDNMACRELKKLLEEEREEGRMELAQRTVYSLAKRGMPLKEIAEIVQVDLPQAENWVEEAQRKSFAVK